MGKINIKTWHIILVIYLFWIVVFAIQKPIFMLFNSIDSVTISDYFNVIAHGIKLDFCFTAYFLFLPTVFLLLNVFIRYNIKKTLNIYNTVFLIIITILFSVDCILYSYWGFRMDATLIFYLRDLGESLNSVTLRDVFKFCIIAIIYSLIVFTLYHFTVAELLKKYTKQQLTATVRKKIVTTVVLIMTIPILVICTRGGLSTATANIGMVYYCDNQKLNLAAVNPSFNLLYSLMKNEDFGNKYQFYQEDFCKREFEDMMSHTDVTDSLSVYGKPSFLTTDRPNIVVIILESFSGRLIGAVNGYLAQYEGKEVTPNLNNMAANSLIFDRAYSNGMRTDRGIVSILSAFPAQPDMSIIKYPEKTATLPSMAKTLSTAGYRCEMVYGGDVNFANMRSYFYGTGYSTVIDYKDFSPKQRLSKWGVRDEVMFEYLADRISHYDKTKPFFTTLLTLSSHEPFDVTMTKFQDKYVNSIAYTDSCLGVFMNRLKTNGTWHNTLVILVADHASKLPENVSPQDADFYHIPIIFTGGVIKEPKRISRLMNQTDIAKTVFTAMNLPCEDFTYSRDILNPTYNEYAIFVYSNGFGFMDNSGTTVWDKDANKVIYGEDDSRETKGKVWLQALYKDISSR